MVPDDLNNTELNFHANFIPGFLITKKKYFKICAKYIRTYIFYKKLYVLLCLEPITIFIKHLWTKHVIK